MKEDLYANGKLLITGEYLIIDGAQSLALPCKFGQHLNFESNNSSNLIWKSYDNQNNCWFYVSFSNELSILDTNSLEKALYLKTVLTYCIEHTDPHFKTLFLTGATIKTHLTFPTNWGLGSSSTLLVLLAKLFKIDAFELHFSVTKGSGYDIACGMHSGALLYQLTQKTIYPDIVILESNPLEKLKDSLFFIHLNKKQKSDNEIINYNVLKKNLNLKRLCNSISLITKNLLSAPTLPYFNELMKQHETLLSEVLQRKTVQEVLFDQYKEGIVKSLGAWGGDFVLATGTLNDMNYFRNLGYDTILSYDEIIL